MSGASKRLPHWAEQEGRLCGVVVLLALVGLEPNGTTLLAWTDEQAQAAQDWASACHLRASDNDVAVPARPSFLPDPWKGPEADADLWGSSPTVF